MIDGKNLPKTLLIVDDDQSLRQILCWGFEDLGYLARGAGNCREAVACASAMSFDFALIDYRLPDGNGRALSQTLTKLLPALQTILMGVDRTAALAEMRNTPSATKFIEKPVEVARVHRFFMDVDSVGGPRHSLVGTP